MRTLIIHCRLSLFTYLSLNSWDTHILSARHHSLCLLSSHFGGFAHLLALSERAVSATLLCFGCWPQCVCSLLFESQVVWIKFLGYSLFLKVSYILFGIKHYCPSWIIFFPSWVPYLLLEAHGIPPPPRFSPVLVQCAWFWWFWNRTWCALAICCVRSFFILNFRKTKVLVFVFLPCLGFLRWGLLLYIFCMCQFCLGSFLFITDL